MQADEAAEKERERSLDPANTDPGKSVALLQKIELGRDRLDAALPRPGSAMRRRVPASTPRSDHRRLLGAELVARNLEYFTDINPPIAKLLQLPQPGETSHLAFPPAPVNFRGAGRGSGRRPSAAYGPDLAAAHEAENELRRAAAMRAQARNERAIEKEKQDYYAAQRVAEEYRRTGHKP